MPHRPGPPWGDGHHWGHAWGSGGSFSFLTIIWWLVLLVGVAWLAWWWLGPRLRPWLATLFARQTTAPSALELLRLRYASGEIDDETFEQMQERLEASYNRQIPIDGSGYHRYRQRQMSRQREQRGLYLVQPGVKTSEWERSKKLREERTHRVARTRRSMLSRRQEAVKRARWG